MQTADNAQFHIVLVKGWVRQQDRFLLAQRSAHEVNAAGDWALPGGKVETENERGILQKTLTKEIMEEVGVRIGDRIELVDNASFTRDDGAHVVGMTFLCEWADGEAQPLEDTDEVRWLTLEELLVLEMKPWMRKDIEALARYLSLRAEV